MGKFLSYKRQEKATETRQAFSKAKSVYGKHMEDAVVIIPEKSVHTDFHELIKMRNQRSEKYQKGYARFFFLLGLGLVIFIILNLSFLSDSLL